MFRLSALVMFAAALALTGCDRAAADAGARRGAVLIARTGCGSCHVIPGIPGATGRVGPPLTTIGSQAIVAGMLANTHENLVTWIRTPQSVVPGNAMPNMELNDHDAGDIASYLSTLR